MDKHTHDEGSGRGDAVAGATGGAGGAVAGAALGSLAGPIGTIIGGLAGAVGGWWAGRSIADSPAFNTDDDRFYEEFHQKTYGTTADQVADRLAGGQFTYNDVRPAYQLGHLAGVNPDYGSQTFDDVEPHLADAYRSAGARDEWTNVRQYARDAWSRGRDVGTERVGFDGAPIADDRQTAENRETNASTRQSTDGSTVDTRLADYGRTLRDS